MSQNPPSKLPNPFAAASAAKPGASGGASTPGSRPAQPPTPNPPAAPAPSAPRPGAFGSRFGPSRTNWRLLPTQSKIVRFDLSGMGDPFYRLLGRPLTVELADSDAVIKALEAGSEAVEEIAARLEVVWPQYDLRGAIALYTWREELRDVFVGRVPSSGDEEPETYDDDKPAPPVVLRALDWHLVLNVLGRTRANILLSRAPLAFESAYLAQSVYTDDPRLVILAQATGCMEEMRVK